jgi:hypothetical protein
MSRTDKADRIRDAFLDALRSQGASVESMADLAATSSSTVRKLFLALGQAGREAYLVRGVGIINVHVRSEAPGWWSILKTVKRDLDLLAKEFQTKCFYVLLVGRDDQHVADGYIANDFAASPFTRPPGVEKTKYTVNEKQHLDRRKLLLSVGKVAKVLLEARAVAAL